MTTFSIIMPSYLGQYKTAATNRPAKLARAIQSVIKQSYPHWELVVVADGCAQTINIASQFAIQDNRIKIYHTSKKKLWSGDVRNAGIQNASGEWIAYLDADDMLGVDHLTKIVNSLSAINRHVDWVYFPDWSYNQKTKCFDPHEINITRQGQCGTSNIAHLRKLGAKWPRNGDYQHDWGFINTLRKLSKDYAEIARPEYLICHVPALLDYDGSEIIYKT